jgi:hypothetical protein
MTTASRSLATALPKGALRERLAPPNYTTTEDTTVQDTCRQDIAVLVGLDNCSEFSAPYTKQFIFQIIADYSTSLPIAFVELLSHTNGCRFGDVKIYGLSELNSIVLEDTAVIAFAEIEGKGVFAVEEEKSSKMIFFFDYIEDTRSKLGVDLLAAFKAKLAT